MAGGLTTTPDKTGYITRMITGIIVMIKDLIVMIKDLIVSLSLQTGFLFILINLLFVFMNLIHRASACISLTSVFKFVRK